MANPTYLEMAVEANKPIGSRSAVVSGRGGNKRVPRRYHVTDSKHQEIQSKILESGKFVSPFRKGGGAYNAIIEALVSLGENKIHSCGSVYSAFEDYLKTIPSKKNAGKNAWDDYDGKESRSSTTGRDGYGRFLQNCMVLQRLSGANQYGFKLAQLGACIDLIKTDGVVSIRLRTGIKDLVKPIAEGKTRTYKNVSGISPGPLGLDKVSLTETEQV